MALSTVARLQYDHTPGVAITVDVPIDGEQYTLSLQPHSVRAPGYQLLIQDETGAIVPVEPGPERTLRGEIVDQPGSFVAASSNEDGLYARILMNDGNEYWIEPVRGLVPGYDAEDHVIYHTDDVYPHGGSCAADQMGHVDPVSKDSAGSGSGIGTRGSLCTAELACDADFEYYQAHGSSVTNVESQINSIINSMNVQYEGEVGITHLVTAIVVRTSSNDPYTSSDPGTLLNQFTNEWNSNQGSIQRDVAELFTGRNMNGGVIGIAWLSAVCTSSGYNVVESDFNGNFSCKTDLSAHELGHNWGADHCSCTSNTMNPFITCANTFHPSFTIPEIIAFRDSRSCLDCGPLGDVVYVVMSIKQGTVLSGDLPELAASDDQYWIAQSEFLLNNQGNPRQRVNSVLVMESPTLSPSAINARVELAADLQGTKTRFKMRNYTNGTWVVVDGPFTTETVDTLHQFSITNNAASFVNFNSRMRLRILTNELSDTQFNLSIDEMTVTVN
ncbi:MAG: hypothetical protein D6744_15960 [Planctomycetota bacterium]|nr:MAG: hypothetical protein D6744_15960 [Planctomycetota bacterium]